MENLHCEFGESFPSTCNVVELFENIVQSIRSRDSDNVNRKPFFHVPYTKSAFNLRSETFLVKFGCKFRFTKCVAYTVTQSINVFNPSVEQGKFHNNIGCQSAHARALICGQIGRRIGVTNLKWFPALIAISK